MRPPRVPVQEQQCDARTSSNTGRARCWRKLLTEPSKADRSTRTATGSPRLVRAKTPTAGSGHGRTAAPVRPQSTLRRACASQRSYQIATIEVTMPAAAARQDPVQRLEILLAERVVDQEFQAERHDDVEQRLDHDAETDEGQHLLVVGQQRLDEAKTVASAPAASLAMKTTRSSSSSSSSSRASTSSSSSSSSSSDGGGSLPASGRTCPTGVSSRASFRARGLSYRRGDSGLSEEGRLWRHETNRCCTAGMIPLIERDSAGRYPRGDPMRSGSIGIRNRLVCCDQFVGGSACLPCAAQSVVRFDLVEERIAQAVGVGIPLARPLVRRQRRRPQRVGASRRCIERSKPLEKNSSDHSHQVPSFLTPRRRS